MTRRSGTGGCCCAGGSGSDAVVSRPARSEHSPRHTSSRRRELLTRRTVTWAADALADDDTTVSALARRLDVDWPTLWNALQIEAQHRTADPARLSGVESLGVDEHVWRAGQFGAGLDLSRDQNGQVRARLLDLVLGRSGPAYAGWLTAQTPTFRATVKHAALDPFRATPTRCAITCPTQRRC